MELAVVLVVVGFVMGGAMYAATPFLERARVTGTQKKLEKISDALSRYAQNYMTLPCPANPNPTVEPFGAPMGSGASGTTMNTKCSDTPLRHNGIVPFAVLGLNESDIKDSYGNYITYTISPVFDLLNYRISYHSPSSSPMMVNNQCATIKWRRLRRYTSDVTNYWTPGHYWQPTWTSSTFPAIIGEETPDGYEKPLQNRNKARLCCPAYDAVMNSTYGDNLLNVYEDNTYSGSLARPYFKRHDGLTYQHHGDAYDTSWHDDILNPDFDEAMQGTATEYVAFVLLSHGRNGDGAYLRGGGQRPRTTTIATTTETDNWNVRPTLSFVSRPLALEQDNNYFDDILLWRTNRQLISANGTDSCSGP